ncbi:type II RES/Xre toxin-antitoxin system antitoxin [Pedobacter sp.]|uniref:type II RES/Xre toxin-antitoxin system antitoxin n=1 Tax=Pedobacter sp. TaxID=1411316 RepID=UPI003D7FA728
MEANNISPVKRKRRIMEVKNDDFNKIIQLIRAGSNLDIITEVKKGLSRRVFDGLKDQTNLDFTRLSKIVGTTSATIHKKKTTDKFNKLISEKIIAVAALYDFGYEVFEDKNDFDAWMGTENTALAEKKPIELIDTVLGLNEVRNVIGRIQYGVYA